MAWTNEIDPAEPQDTDPAAEGALEFRTLKAAISERLASRLPGWPTSDPLPILGIDAGDIGDRPATPAGDGHVFLARTPLPKRLYYGFGGAWEEFTFGATIADFVSVTINSVAGTTIPQSTPHHVFSAALPVASNQEVIGWRYRWRWPALSSSWVGWHATDPAANHGQPDTPTGLVQLMRFEVDRDTGNIHFRFRNDDTSPHDVDLEWAVTLLTVS